MAANSAARRRNLGIVLLLLVGLAGALEAGWLLGFTWAARTGRLESWINRRPDKVEVRFAEVRSVWPGLIEIEGLVVRGRTPRYDWQVDVERIRGQLALLPLLARRASFRAVAGRGVAVRTLRRRDGPPPPGLPAAQTPMTGAPRAPRASHVARPGAARRGPRWTVAFHNVRLEELREIHFDQTRLAGEMRVEGGFALRTGARAAEIFATRLDLDSTTAEHAGELVGRGLAGSIELQVAEWDYRELRGRRLLPRISGRIVATGELDDRPLLAELLRRAPWVEIESARAPIELDLRLRRGRLLEGSSVVTRPVARRLRLLDYAVAGTSTLELTVADRPGAPAEARWAVRFSEFEMTLAGDPRPLLAGHALALAGRVSDPVLLELAERMELALELGDARVPDLTRLADWLPASTGLELLGGSARASAALSVRVADRRPSGRLDIDVERAHLRWSDLDFVGRVVFELPVTDGDLESRRVRLADAKIRISDFDLGGLSPRTEAGRGWWANVHLPNATLRLAPPIEIDGDFTARLRDTVPFVGLFELRRDLPRWAERLLSVEDVDLAGTLSARPRRIELDQLECLVYGGVLKARLRFADHERRGKLLLAWRRLAIGVGFDGSERDLRLRNARDWFAVP
jgi:hypothetical protein